MREVRQLVKLPTAEILAHASEETIDIDADFKEFRPPNSTLVDLLRSYPHETR